MTAKHDRQEREPDPPVQSGELSAWFTDSLRPSSFPAAETTVAPAAASAAEAAPLESPDERGDEPQVASEQPATYAGHSLLPHVLPGEATGPDESATDEPPLAPPVSPWLPGPNRRVVATVVATAAVLASVAFLVLARSCASRTASPEASETAAAVQDAPRVNAADLPPAPEQPNPAGSAQAMPPEPNPNGSPALGLLPPAGADAQHWAPNGSSVARFPDLPPDVLLKLWREEQERKEQAP
jgi:hypothetical protein